MKDCFVETQPISIKKMPNNENSTITIPLSTYRTLVEKAEKLDKINNLVKLEDEKTDKCIWDVHGNFAGYYKTSCNMNYKIGSKYSRCPLCNKEIVIKK